MVGYATLRKFRWQRWLVLGSVAAIALSACTAEESSTDEAATEAATKNGGEDTGAVTEEQQDSSSDTLRIVTAEPQSGIDPAIAVTHASWRVMELIYDGLLDYNPEGEIVPGLAADWEVSDDGTTYTFELQPNAAFSDGSPITADDVVFSLERAAEGEALGASLEIMSSVEAVDDSTIEITLDEPARVFLNALARVGVAGILSEEALTSAEGADAYFRSPTATSGPWFMTEWTPQKGIVLEANPHYWQGAPDIDRIDYTFSSDPTANALALESGTADMHFPAAPAAAVRLADAGLVEMYAPPTPAILFWGLDTEDPRFADSRVRQALAYMVPRDDRREVCWEGTGAVSYGETIHEGSWAYVEGLDRFKVPEDEALETAAELMEESGWVMGDDGVRVSEGVDGLDDGTPFKVDVPFESGWQQSRCNTQLLRDRLAPLGVTINPQAYDPASFWGDVGEGAFAMFHGGNGWSTVDDKMQQGFTTDGLSNSIVAQWSNDEVDALVAQAQRTRDLDEARDLYAEAQQIILDELPIIQTGAQYSVVILRPNVVGYKARADGSNRSLINATIEDQ